MMASDAAKRPYRHLPNPRELNARLWEDPEFHMRLWTDPTLRDAYVRVIDKALLDAITGKEKMEMVADALSDIVMTQVQGELSILGLRDHFGGCLKPIKHIVLGMILAKMGDMKKRLEWTDDENNPI
jgi:hypothetical protein